MTEELHTYYCKDCFKKQEQIDRLEQGNKENIHYLACMTEQRNKLKSALEEIKQIIRADCKRCTAECDCDDDCTRYKIKNKINEVLQ